MLFTLYRHDGFSIEVPGNAVKEYLNMGFTENKPSKKEEVKKEEPLVESKSEDDSVGDSSKKRSYTKK